MATVTKHASSNSIITTGWTNPTNAYSSNDVRATCAPGKNAAITQSYGFADFTTGDIPDSSTINSVTISIEGQLSANVTGGVITGQLFLNGVFDQNTNTITSIGADQIQSGSYSTIPTLAQLRSASTTITIQVSGQKGNTNSALTCSLDDVFVTVDFTPPATVALPFQSRQPNRNMLLRH